jgi:GNAT superfamily N-acetyltransferase
MASGDARTRTATRVRIRRFDARDAEAVSALIATTMRRSNGRDYAPEVLERLIAYFTPAKVTQLAGERHCVIAAVGDRIVGTAALDGAALATFFVHPDHQGHGVGTRLLAVLEDAARAAGLTHVTVDASVTGTPFYERRGYRRTGRTVDGTGGLLIGLAKALAPGGPPVSGGGA